MVGWGFPQKRIWVAKKSLARLAIHSYFGNSSTVTVLFSGKNNRKSLPSKNLPDHKARVITVDRRLTRANLWQPQPDVLVSCAFGQYPVHPLDKYFGAPEFP